jgi:hypothetical protein
MIVLYIPLLYLCWAVFLAPFYYWRNRDRCANSLEGFILALRWPVDLYEKILTIARR